MYWPATIKPGSVYQGLVQNIDYTPTFLELAGMEIDKSDIDGVSLAKVLHGDRKPIHDHLFFELGYARGIIADGWKYIAVRYDKKTEAKIRKGISFVGWQGRKLKYPYYVRNQHLGYHSGLFHPHYFAKDQLYDLKNDPEEKENLFHSNPRKAEEMKNLLIKELQTFDQRPYGEMV